MLVQAGSFRITFSLLETVVKRYNASRMSDFALLHGLYSRDEETLMTIEIEVICIEKLDIICNVSIIADPCR